MAHLEFEPTLPKIDLKRGRRIARQSHGKSYFSQAREILSLAFGKGRISPEEYYYYQLYDDSRYSSAEKRNFAGKYVQETLHLRISSFQTWGLVTNKVNSDNFLSALGFPVPETLAIYRRLASFPAHQCLNTTEDLARFLRRCDVYPLFSKPAGGMRSVGVASLISYDAETDRLGLSDGRSVPVEDFVNTLTPFRDTGYLFQRTLKPHADVARICGNRLATVRLIILLREGHRPEVYRALWKIPAGSNSADNFWRGNLIAAIDQQNGRARDPMTGVGPDQRRVDTHPDTGEQINGVEVPLWGEIRDLCLRASTAFPSIGMQAWDVAATENGPVLIEVNIAGDYNLPQLAWGRGALDEQFEAFLKECRHVYRPSRLQMLMTKWRVARRLLR